MPRRLTVPWFCALIFGVTFLAYWPALAGQMLWDDAGHVTRLDLRSLSGLRRIWTEWGATQQYYPLLHTAFWLEHRVWGDATLGYHLVNIVLHAANACLFALLLRRLAVPGAFIAAALFALHPVCVESVAWISEQKNTLSLLLYLASAMCYLKFDEGRRPGAYAGAAALFALALLTKTVVATLPATLLVIFWWQRRKLEWRRDVVPLLPWFAGGLAAGLLTSAFETSLIGAQGASFDLSWLQRVLLAGRVVAFYLGKLVWPAELVFIYPRWTIDPRAAWQYLFPGALLVLVTVLLLRRARWPGRLAALLCFVGALVPALGFVNVYPFIFSFVADHFQYLASLAIFALAGAALTRVRVHLAGPAQGLSVGLLVTALGVLTWRQCRIYRDGLSLYRATLQGNPDCWMAHNNLGEALTVAGRVSEAIPEVQRALVLRPDFPEAENNLGDDLRRAGQPAEGVPHLQRAIQLHPRYPQAHNNLGVAWMAMGRASDGLAEFRTAVELKPEYAEARYNLGLALANLGHTAEATLEFERAVALAPDYGEAQLSLGIGLLLSGRFSAALPHFERAVRLQPNSYDVRSKFGRALMEAGRMDDGIAQLRAGTQLVPDFAEAHLNLALALAKAGRTAEATSEYNEARRLQALEAANRQK
jgi:tetratricopeptide (TPR) repeat protein